MRLASFSAALVAAVMALPAWAQNSALSQIEQQLPNPRGAAPAPAEPAPPANGYLGFEPDEESDIGQGVRVKTVKPGAPGAKSGLKDRDLIVQVDGKVITGLPEFDPILDRSVPGQKLEMIVVRENRRVPLTITLGNWPAPGAPSEPLASDAPPPAPPGASGTLPSLIPPTGSPASPVLPGPAAPDTGRTPGIVATPQEPRTPAFESPGFTPAPSGASAAAGNASLGVTVGPPGEQRTGARRRGAYVAGVRAGSPAEQVGLKMGNVIVQMDGRKIDSDDDLINAIRAARAGQAVELRYYDGDQLETKTVRLASAGAAAPSAPPSATPAPGLSGILGGRGGAGNRPLLNRVEQAVDGLSRAAQGGTLPIASQYDPQAMAALQRSVADLAAAVSSLEERLKALEGRPGGTTTLP